ncbi:hypothetical protein C8Q80DRAFT_1120612 [Daedaleopsis nitida]|nr:hypothetical protein C8Q80DRAFT_1120612 [Daedaleopsis nitida]
MDSPPAPVGNLTPARKHHKLLKDGSEVWSKDVEKVFVDGLREYWQSPWATYSRGRSRWRNQFLVDHLKRNGIVRTKKQVASHIQVLRNMWRGQPEFHLVAGGEELFQENGLLAHTNNTAKSSPGSASTSTLDLPESSAVSESPSSTPEYHTSEVSPEFSASGSYPSLSPPAQVSAFPELDVFTNSMSSSHGPDPAFVNLSPPPQTTHTINPMSVKLEPLAMDPALFTLPQPLGDSLPEYHISFPNRTTSLYFWADGMHPFTIDVDRVVGASPASPSRTFLHLRVSLPPLEDLSCPPGLQGISGAVSFANPWTSFAKCHTKVWGEEKTVISLDQGLFTPVTTPELQAALSLHASPQTVYAYLPDSPLSRCHWLGTVRTITQQIVVDNEVLAVLVYHLERVADGPRPAPAMELIGVQKYPWRGVGPSSAASSSSFQLGSSPSPPISPHSPTFSHAYAYASCHGRGRRRERRRRRRVLADDVHVPSPLPFGYPNPH